MFLIGSTGNLEDIPTHLVVVNKLKEALFWHKAPFLTARSAIGSQLSETTAFPSQNCLVSCVCHDVSKRSEEGLKAIDNASLNGSKGRMWHAGP